MAAWILCLLLFFICAPDSSANEIKSQSQGGQRAKNSQAIETHQKKTAAKKAARIEELKKKLRTIDRMLEKIDLIRDYYSDSLEDLTEELQVEAEEINQELDGLRGVPVVKKSPQPVSLERASSAGAKSAKKSRQKKRDLKSS